MNKMDLIILFLKRKDHKRHIKEETDKMMNQMNEK